ncbi:hypothetical protein MAR_016902 [Mya arenaria]|uniref:BZIP domain-containing protein n=1 Tax=Mya arenaria TaxID=6604 RepID=A0ABY7ECQ8_MYAAR|nr:uncharacterized protein LOC128239259 [Mya arenaria]WAR06944.1 hypothetical protein MAR_016902 [Mya arenaria]
MSVAVAIPPMSKQMTKMPEHANGQKKLPRPIVFWSVNEKTAYRRNRVVQTRMNMVMDDIATQRETSRKTIRYEAHKFRQKNSRHYNHPLGTSLETQASGVNIAPPNWRRPQERQAASVRKSKKADSDDESTSGDDDDDEDVSPIKCGIITRAKKPTVKFSQCKVVRLENNLKIDDLDNIRLDFNESADCNRNSKANMVRSVSAVQQRKIPDLPGQQRNFSALPAVRTQRCNHGNSKGQCNGRSGFLSRECTCDNMDNMENGTNRGTSSYERRSETYFDKSKAAYQLRQDLRRRAKMRKQGIKSTVFTLKDALNLEKENFIKSNEKVVDYLTRIEAMKRAEMVVVNKWTRDAIVQQLNI